MTETCFGCREQVESGTRVSRRNEDGSDGPTLGVFCEDCWAEVVQGAPAELLPIFYQALDNAAQEPAPPLKPTFDPQEVRELIKEWKEQK